MNKAAAEKAYQDRPIPGAAMGAGQAGVQGVASGGTQAFSPLRNRLDGDVQNLASQLDRSVRAKIILERHPEFEEFIELLGLIRVDLRFRPLQSARALVTE
jgi:hypothetical protein